ncbi:hypothetical protein J5N97_014315 [Dioscorea zingiberensis]|uniref:Glycosyltransferase 61 catalytic domain-containing protein n=1 Tax=Dioscorea zingiberensis TaxID=325984 RepID=A0A9D5HJL1_9LILI|nr:hypothetical protein J5N97_014315 [Dioscorea zingiberensis]
MVKSHQHLTFFHLFSLISCTLLFLLFFSPPFLFFSQFPVQSFVSNNISSSNKKIYSNGNANINNGGGPCSSITNNTICCDRTSYHTDVCFMRGDVRTHPPSFSITLYSTSINASLEQSHELKIKPYTRKWEAFLQDKIEELSLKVINASPSAPILHCDIHHDAPALFFSAGGYTGNLFHAFNNGILPLYITSQHLNRRVIFVVLQDHKWWHTRYHEILSQLSGYPPIIFSKDEVRTHCFPEAIIGLRFHGTLTIDPTQMNDRKTAEDFHQFLDKAYKHRAKRYMHVHAIITDEKPKPRLVIISRNGSRAIENEGELVQLGKKIGFHVQVMKPECMELAEIYQVLNSSNVMVGVHGAGLTHFLFMRPGSVLVQIVPIGVDELARSCFGEPAEKLGMKYVEYKIEPRESSLYRKYEDSDPVLSDPESVNGKGWQVTKDVYLEGQNVSLDLQRIGVHLVRVFQYVVSLRGL